MMKLIVPSICNVGIRSLFKKYWRNHLK
jgi:hypothetical protein